MRGMGVAHQTRSAIGGHGMRQLVVSLGVQLSLDDFQRQIVVPLSA